MKNSHGVELGHVPGSFLLTFFLFNYRISINLYILIFTYFVLS